MRTSSNFPFSMSVLILNWGDLDDNGVGGGGTSGKICGQAFTLTIQRTSSFIVSFLENCTTLFLNLLQSLLIIQRKRKPYLQERYTSSTLFYLQNAMSYTMIPAEDIMDLLKLCLAPTSFHYNGNHYRQLHGTAMESPVSVVVAEIVMQNIEKRGL